jgi:serine/threonine-protein kinase
MLKPMIRMISNLVEKPWPKGKWIQDRYEIISLLGSGSYGHSYLVYDRLKNTRAVLKALRWHKRITKKGKNSFTEEMDLLKSLNHPSFPAFFESGSFAGIPYFTMEFIDGKTFEQLIFHEGKKYGELESFIIGYKLLEILSDIQQAGIVHRDIRIPNIMWDGNRVRVIDLGLAKRITPADEGRKKGVDHPRKQLDFKSDYYGLGHFLLFLLYSSYIPPADGKEKSWEEELPISRQGKKIIRKLLQIDSPYESCNQVKHDFENMIEKIGGRVNENVII